jgi:hypothetical protein
MVRARRASTTFVASLLAFASFAACSGSAFKQDEGQSGAGSSSAGATTAGGGSAHAGSASGGTGNQAGAGGTTPTLGSGGAGLGGGAVGGTTSPAAGGEGGAGEEPLIPQQGLFLWFKADAGVKVENGTVTAWADQSGNGYDAVQSDADAQPKLSNSASLPLPVLELDGVKDHLDLPPMTPPLSDGLSFFAVAGRSAESTCSALMELSNGGEVDDISFDSLGNSFQFEVVSSTAYANADAFPQGELRLIEVLQSSDPVQPMAELRANGAEVGRGNVMAPLPILRGDNAIGDSLYADCTPFPGALAEIILYSRKLETSERLAVESYLKQKWQCCN